MPKNKIIISWYKKVNLKKKKEKKYRWDENKIQTQTKIHKNKRIIQFCQKIKNEPIK